QVAVTAVGMGMDGLDPTLRDGPHHDRSRAVAQDHAGAAVRPVGDVRQGVDADDERMELAVVEDLLDVDLVVGLLDGVDEAGATGAHVGGGSRFSADLSLQLGGEAGEPQPGVDRYPDVSDLPGVD